MKAKTCAIAKCVHFPSRFGIPKAHHDRLRDLSRLYSYGKILVVNSKWLPDLPRVDFQGGSLWFLEEKHRFSIL